MRAIGTSGRSGSAIRPSMPAPSDRIAFRFGSAPARPAAAATPTPLDLGRIADLRPDPHVELGDARRSSARQSSAGSSGLRNISAMRVSSSGCRRPSCRAGHGLTSPPRRDFDRYLRHPRDRHPAAGSAAGDLLAGRVRRPAPAAEGRQRRRSGRQDLPEACSRRSGPAGRRARPPAGRLRAPPPVAPLASTSARLFHAAAAPRMALERGAIGGLRPRRGRAPHSGRCRVRSALRDCPASAQDGIVGERRLVEAPDPLKPARGAQHRCLSAFAGNWSGGSTTSAQRSARAQVRLKVSSETTWRWSSPERSASSFVLRS